MCPEASCGDEERDVELTNPEDDVLVDQLYDEERELRKLEELADVCNQLSPAAARMLWEKIDVDNRPEPPPDPSSTPMSHTDFTVLFDALRFYITRYLSPRQPPEAPNIKIKVSVEDGARLNRLEGQRNGVLALLRKHEHWQHAKSVQLPKGNKGRILQLKMTTHEAKAAAIRHAGDLEKLLSVKGAVVMPDTYHVLAHDINMTKDDFYKNVELDDVRKSNGYHHLSDIRYSFGLLVFTFESKREAIDACRRNFFINGDMGYLLPVDIRGIPIYCRKCSRPGHLSDYCDNEVCCGFCHEAHWSHQCDHKRPARCVTCTLENAAQQSNSRKTARKYLDVNHVTFSRDCKAFAAAKQFALCKAIRQHAPVWGLCVYGNVASAEEADVLAVQAKSVHAGKTKPKSDARMNQIIRSNHPFGGYTAHLPRPSDPKPKANDPPASVAAAHPPTPSPPTSPMVETREEYLSPCVEDASPASPPATSNAQSTLIGAAVVIFEEDPRDFETADAKLTQTSAVTVYEFVPTYSEDPDARRATTKLAASSKAQSTLTSSAVVIFEEVPTGAPTAFSLPAAEFNFASKQDGPQRLLPRLPVPTTFNPLPAHRKGENGTVSFAGLKRSCGKNDSPAKRGRGKNRAKVVSLNINDMIDKRSGREPATGPVMYHVEEKEAKDAVEEPDSDAGESVTA